jgi:hypothetical protein
MLKHNNIRQEEGSKAEYRYLKTTNKVTDFIIGILSALLLLALFFKYYENYLIYLPLALLSLFVIFIKLKRKFISLGVVAVAFAIGLFIAIYTGACMMGIVK